MTSAPVFYYDLTDPISYLAAERIHSVMDVVAEWEPVLGLDLGAEPAEVDVGWLEHRAQELELLAFRLPSGIRAAGADAALAATYAKQIGKTVSYSLAAFRQAFAGGHNLDEESTLLLAGAAAEIHPRALLQAIGRQSVADALERACDRARVAGVAALPAIEVAGSLVCGDDAVEQAAALISVAELRDT